MSTRNYFGIIARIRAVAVVLCVGALGMSVARSAPFLRGSSIRIADRFAAPPRWAVLERRLLAESVPACREFFHKYFDDRGYLQCVVRWGANDGPDDAFENFNRWPELHALGADDDIRQMFLKGHEGLLKQSNYDSVHKIIRSMQNGSRGPMLRQATAIDWVGDPFDVSQYNALHGESTFAQFLEHYKEYTDVVGDHFLNLVATTLPMHAYLIANEPKYKKWIVD